MELSRTRLVLMSICVGGVFIDWGLLLSLLPPFYPTEAESKGATPAQYGFVFGIANLAAFLSAIVFSKLGARLGPKLVINIGGLAQGLAGVCFALLEYVDGKSAFLGLSYLLRFIDGVADAAAWGALISIMMNLFPQRVAFIMSWTETFFGLGYTVGPVVGSLFYTIGGFKLPFLIVGCLGIFLAICLVFLIPKVGPNEQRGKETKEDCGGQDTGPELTWKLVLSSWPMVMPFVDDVVCFLGYGFVESMLEQHMKDAAGASQVQVSFAFLVMGAVYMIMAPIAGFVCDRIGYPIILSIVGNSTMALAMILVGPAPFLASLHPTVSLIICSTGIIGFAYSQIMVSTFSRAFLAAMRMGCPDNIATYLMISGLWSSSFYLGNFVGPTAGGLLVQNVGFRSTTMVFFSFYLVMIIVDSVELWVNVKRGWKKPKKGYTEVPQSNEELTDESTSFVA